MDLRQIGEKILDFAPLIGGALLGPAGAAGGAAVQALARALGLKSDAKPDDVAAYIGQEISPEIRLKILVAEQDFRLKQRDQDLEELRVTLADVQSARAREVEVTKATGTKDTNLYILPWTVIVGFFLLVIFLLYNQVPKDQNGVVFMLFGALATGFGTVLQYFFGSSRSSQDKTDLLAKAEPIK